MSTFSSLKEHCAKYHVELVAVSKTKPNEAILQLYEKGQRIFGENRVQELTEKHETLPKDIQWHMIGHLQTNKVKFIAPFVKMIHSADRQSLIKEINKEAEKTGRTISILLQLKIAQEDSKHGWDRTEILQFLASGWQNSYPHIHVRGVMGMATFTDNKAVIRSEFNQLKSFFDELKSNFFADQTDFDTLSMGMSGDYKIAIEEGSTMIRVGSLLFGSRS